MSSVEGVECEDYDECEAGVGGRARQTSDLRRRAKPGWLLAGLEGLTHCIVSVE